MQRMKPWLHDESLHVAQRPARIDEGVSLGQMTPLSIFPRMPGSPADGGLLVSMRWCLEIYLLQKC